MFISKAKVENTFTSVKKLVFSGVFIILMTIFPATGFTEYNEELDDLRCGSFFLIDQETKELTRSVTLKTDIQLQVTGIVIRGRVVQAFTNQSTKWMEGVYMFPLPESAAVDTLLMKIGDRVIEGVIKEKEEAKQIYEEAKAEGKKASLLEQDRPNIFNVSIANIGPSETIEVIIEFQQSVEYDNGQYSFLFPMVVGPRYIPLSTVFSGDEKKYKDAGKITTPIDTTGTADYPISLRIDLKPGFPVKNIDSPYLPVTVTKDKKTDNYYTIVPANGSNAKRKDFVLTWEAENPAKTYTAVFNEEVNGNVYTLLMIHPPEVETIKSTAYNREVIIIIDTSGSMQGESIKQAKKALLTALDQLNSNDIFNIIAFNSYTTKLFDKSAGMNYKSIADAKAFVNSLEADQGTEMAPALEAALSPKRDADRLFQVIFITDGCVGNESELFTYIKKTIGTGRLFTIAIGSAPNHYFMRKSALIGRGSFISIASEEEVLQKMSKLFKRLAYPVLTDIKLSWANSSAETLPDPIPDLYAGEPISVCTKSYLKAGDLVISGSMGGQTWNQRLSFPKADDETGVGKLWARRKIEFYTDQAFEGVEDDVIKQSVIPLALEHHLVSQYTSLVAVEQVKSRPDDAESGSEELPQLLPDGWEMGQSDYLAGAGTEVWLYFAIGIVLVSASAFVFIRMRKSICR